MSQTNTDNGELTSLSSDINKDTLWSKMKIYIIGITGMLGSELFKRFYENKSFKVRGSTKKIKLLIFKKYKKCIDFNISVNNLDNLKKKILDFKPDCVINCVGIIKQKISQKSNLDDIIYINSIFLLKLYFFLLKNNKNKKYK